MGATIMDVFRAVWRMFREAIVSTYELATSRYGLAGWAFTFVFALVVFLFPGTWIIEFANYTGLTLSAIVFALWVPYAAHAARAGNGSGAAALLVAIALIALGIVGGLGWSIGWRWVDRPAWMLDSPVVAYTRLLLCGGLALAIVSPGMRGDELPVKHVGLVAVGCLLAGILLGFGISAAVRADPVANEVLELGAPTAP